MNEENGDVSTVLLRRDERSRCSVEKLVTQGPDPGIEIRVEQGLTESINPRREIGPRNSSPAIVIFADKLVTERSSALASTLIASFCGPAVPKTTRSVFLCSPPKSSRATTHSGNPSARTTSPAGNNRRKKSRNSSGGAALAVLNHDLASSFALR